MLDIIYLSSLTIIFFLSKRDILLFIFTLDFEHFLQENLLSHRLFLQQYLCYFDDLSVFSDNCHVLHWSPTNIRNKVFIPPAIGNYPQLHRDTCSLLTHSILGMSGYKSLVSCAIWDHSTGIQPLKDHEISSCLVTV